MKQVIKVLALIFLGFFGFLVVPIFDQQEIFLESKESKTIIGGPVFNKIKWFQFKDRDVWMMNQSHYGTKGSAANSWDRLAIVIDKTQSPKRARFYQFEPGPLEWREDLVEKSFKVSCFMCHNNGPRNIRPNYDSPFNPTQFKDRIRIFYWNLRMKLYGRVIPSAFHDEKDQIIFPPFRFRSPYENEHLNVATCVKCHQEKGLFARGFLNRQQILTIKFMLESGQMPPMGFWLSNQEKKEIEMFLEGF